MERDLPIPHLQSCHHGPGLRHPDRCQRFHRRRRDRDRGLDGDHAGRVHRARRVRLFLLARQSAERHRPERLPISPERQLQPSQQPQQPQELRARAEVVVADVTAVVGDRRHDRLHRAAYAPGVAAGRRAELPARACPRAAPACHRDHDHVSHDPDDRDRRRGRGHDGHGHDDGRRPREGARCRDEAPAQRQGRAVCRCRRRSATASRKYRSARPARALAGARWSFPSRSSAAAELSEPWRSRPPAGPQRRALRAWRSPRPRVAGPPGSDG